ncbi:uncharacterized protein LOC126318465 [Schistocerca gregaria]|uniref:uncharacterized protein LOC126318465 n=1 Tax=Schistocerca gregaria TaxID=7010 RepID=UPI00211E94D2|nr:uncharacterized protein LOC126318465 [Schistocerca gregaria]
MWSKPSNHFDLRLEEQELFHGIQNIKLRGIWDPRRACNIINVEQDANMRQIFTSVNDRIFLKYRFILSRELNICPSVRIYVDNGMPLIDQPQIEFIHNRMLRSSSLFLSYCGLTMMHMRPIYSDQRIWVSGLISYIFEKEALRPLQSSCTLRYHPRNLSNALCVMSFDCHRIVDSYNILRNGILTLTYLTKNKNLTLGVSASCLTTYKPFSKWVGASRLSIGGLWTLSDRNVTVRASAQISPGNPIANHRIRLLTAYLIPDVGASLYAYAKYGSKYSSPKFGIGIRWEGDNALHV